jgi:glutathione S-transferase
MLTVLGRATSSNVQPVMWAIAELGLRAERLDYGHRYGGLDTPEFRALNPNGLIPVLKDGELVVWESCAILRYLAARYGDGGAFWPSDPVARAPVDQWAEWGKTTVAAAFTGPIFWRLVRLPPAQRDARALARAIADFEGVLDILEARLTGRDYVCGAFSLADIGIGHVFYRWFDLPIDRRPRPAVEAWYARLTERPPFRAHVMIPYDELRPEAR